MSGNNDYSLENRIKKIEENIQDLRTRLIGPDDHIRCGSGEMETTNNGCQSSQTDKRKRASLGILTF